MKKNKFGDPYVKEYEATVTFKKDTFLVCTEFVTSKYGINDPNFLKRFFLGGVWGNKNVYISGEALVKIEEQRVSSQEVSSKEAPLQEINYACQVGCKLGEGCEFYRISSFYKRNLN
jgi:hypothetical protein